MINDIKGVYSAKNHPDVRKGSRTEDEVLGEFLETFELHHNLKVSNIHIRCNSLPSFLSTGRHEGPEGYLVGVHGIL